MTAPPSGAASTVATTVGRRGRSIGIAALVAIGMFLLYRYVCSRSGSSSGKNGNGARGVYAPDARESSLRDKDAADVRAALQSYDKDYQARMAQMVAPKEKEGARPFIGFSLADNVRPGRLVVDGIFDKGPAYQVGVDIDHELIAIAGEKVSDIAKVRELVMRHCRPGHMTSFTFFDDAKEKQYETQVWVMTADETFRGKPYYFSAQKHEVRQSDRLKQTWRPGQVASR